MTINKTSNLLDVSFSKITKMDNHETQKRKKVKKKKKGEKRKKGGYKQFLKQMMAPQKTEAEARKAHEAEIKRNLGGGNFSKVSQI